MAYISSGSGKGEINLNLRKYAFSSEDVRKLEATIRNFKQVKTVRIEDNWLRLEASLNQLAGTQLEEALQELQDRIVRTIEHKVESNSAVATTT